MPFVFLVLFYLFLVLFLSFHFDLNIQWQGDDERKTKNPINPSMNAYGNVTLGMDIQMQFKSIHLFETKHANEWMANRDEKKGEKFHKNG